MNRTHKLFIAFLTLLLVAALGFSVRNLASASPRQGTSTGTGISTFGGGTLPDSMNKACFNNSPTTPGSFNCYWDARNRGNHTGHSFVVRKLPNSNLFCVFYVWSGYRNHDLCFVPYQPHKH